MSETTKMGKLYTNHRSWTNAESTLLVQAWDVTDKLNPDITTYVEIAERDNPGHTWGPPQRRTELPTWIGNLIQQGGSEADERELRQAFQSLTWEPGDLSTHEAERILTDVLADIWRDCYRRGNPAARRIIFRERVTNAVKNATGDEGLFRWTD